MSEKPEEWDRSRDEIISGEYVLGVLSAEDRRKVEARIAVDRRFAQQVRRWQINLANFNEDYDEVRPPASLYNRVERRLFSIDYAPEPSLIGSLWNSVLLWRGLTVASLVLAAGVAAFEFADLVPGPKPRPLVAELTGDKATMNLVATYDNQSGRLSVVPVALKQAEPKSLEVWLIEDGKAPASLGVLPDNGNGEIMVSAEMQKFFSEGRTLAITIEPYGGSPDGKPTGPVIAAGTTRFL